MAYVPVSSTVPQYSKDGDELASGYYLKGYVAGTTTPLAMGTDVTPTTTLAKCKLSALGYPLSNDSDETSVFIPHFDEDFKLVLYLNETDADANTTANAVWVVDNIPATQNTTIDHDLLFNWVANKHIDHTLVTITLEEGIGYSSGGTDISADATATLDIPGLTEETTLDITNDDMIFYDDSASAHRKVPLEEVFGIKLGDGKWYRNATQALSAATEATVVYNAANYDVLERGTFDTGTGQYTAGSTSVRIWAVARVTVAALDDDESMEIEIQLDGTTVLRDYLYNDTDNDTPETSREVSGPITMASGAVVRVRATTSSAETISAGNALTYFGIMEIG